MAYTPGAGILSRGDFILQAAELVQSTELITNNKRITYYNIPAAFDIEVSSFYQNGQKAPENKRAIMYIWQFGLGNLVTTGRTWDEFIAFTNVLAKVLSLDNDLRLVVYVHNLPYEFGFMRKRFEWDEVFILSERKPVYARTVNGIEFRCSLKLSGGRSLAAVGKELQKYPVQKKEGDLDYELIRTPLTPLSSTELGYCENDIRVILHYIQEKIEQDGDITRIPLTNTGYVRNYCRKECYKRWKPYRRIMDQLEISSDEYSQLKRAFQGGFTHANAHHVQKVCKDVASYDFTSSYPAVMLLKKFPMSSAKLVDGTLSESSFTELLATKCCMFDVEFHDLQPKLHHEHPLSRSKCIACENATVDNGRVVSADRVVTTVTEQDFFIYSEFYTWGDYTIRNFHYYDKNYLPKVFTNAILGLYQMKTQLKGVEGEELNYMISKNMMNSAYGMSVTDPVRKSIKYIDNEYVPQEMNMEEAIEKYNKNRRRFLYYPWGVWVTAHARANLFSGIIECGEDYIYADTDSLKIFNHEQHKKYFEHYDEEIYADIAKVADFRHQDPAQYSPLNRKGVAKPIGVWDFEGVYDEFKTLGAKRYLTRHGEDYVLTLAGANKRKSCAYLVSTGEPFERFDDDLKIPAENAGRLILTYIDDEIQGTVVDYLGVPFQYTELSAIHMEPSEYSLTMSDEFINYLMEVRDLSE